MSNSVDPQYGQMQPAPGGQGQAFIGSSEGEGDQASANLKMFQRNIKAIGCVLLTLVLYIVCLIAEYYKTNWECVPNAPPSIYGLEYMPRNITLDESAAGAFDSLGGRSVHVFAGSERRERLPGEPELGSFHKVWTYPWAAKFGYVERTSVGDVLRFTAYQSWAWWHTAWIVEPCEKGQPIYEISRDGSVFGSFDGTFHNIFIQDATGGTSTKIASADHVTSGLNVGAGLFTGVDLNLKWSIVFKSVGEPQNVLAMAYQWYNTNLLANYGTSNWAVNSKNQSALPPGVQALPAHVVAYTSALYDLNTGSERRRRTDSGGGFGRRRKFFGGSRRRYR